MEARFLHDISQMQRAPPKFKVVRYAELPHQPVVERALRGEQGGVTYEQPMPDYENLDQSQNW